MEARLSLPSFEPKLPSVAYSGPDTHVPSNCPSLTTEKRSQQMGQGEQPRVLTRYVSISLSPLILSAPSKTPPWKLRLVSSPSSLAVVRRDVVPIRMPEPIATGSCMMSSIACCQKCAYRP